MFINIFTLLSLFVTRSFHKSLQLYTINLPIINLDPDLDVDREHWIPTIILDPDLDPEYWNHGEVPWDFDVENKTKPITITKSISMVTLNPFLII